MEIKRGNKYKCIKDAFMRGTNKHVYIKGRTYVSEQDSCITDECGDKYHGWSSDVSEYFVQVIDRVNHPSHYTWLKEKCGIEVIDITRHLSFDRGNAVKYLLRAGHKTEEGYSEKQKLIEDLKKAIFYINDEIKQLENGD